MSARAIVGLNAELANRKIQSNLFTVRQVHLACTVLGLYIMRHPLSSMVRSDLELLVTSLRFAGDEYRRVGQDPEFIKACSTLRGSVSSFAQSQSIGITHPSRGETPRSQQPAPDNVGSGSAISKMSQCALEQPANAAGIGDPFEGVALGEMWTFFGADGMPTENISNVS